MANDRDPPTGDPRLAEARGDLGEHGLVEIADARHGQLGLVRQAMLGRRLVLGQTSVPGFLLDGSPDFLSDVLHLLQRVLGR